MTQPARQLRPPPRPSVLAQPKRLRFQWERFADIAREVLPLWRLHYQEIAVEQDTVPLDPDWEWFYTVDANNILHVMTVRYGRHLVGYCFNVIGGHNHYRSTRFAHTEMFWLHPHFRKGWQPVKMLLENLRGVKERGAVVATINFKLHFKDARVGQLLARLGYKPTDILMRRVL